MSPPDKYVGVIAGPNQELVAKLWYTLEQDVTT